MMCVGATKHRSGYLEPTLDSGLQGSTLGTVVNVQVGELWQSCAADGHLFQFIVLSLRVLFRKYLNSFVFIE